MSDPTIRISTCRQDGRCPECGDGSAFPFRLLCGCSPCLSSACSLNHTRALLTEAIRQLDDQRERGDQAEAARATQLTESIEALQRVEWERDAAIRERNALLVEVGEALGLLGCNGAPLPERVRQRMADLAMRTRERDEARSEVRTLRLLVESQTEQVSQSAMDLYSAVQSEVAAEERADCAEALLRKCLYPLTDRGYPAEALLAKIREFLAHK